MKAAGPPSRMGPRVVSDPMWYPGPEGQKGQIHSESSGVTDAVLLSRQTVVIGQILCRQRLLLTLRQNPFPAGCPAQSWLSLQHQGSTCRADGDAGSGYPTGAASIRPGRWRSVSFEDGVMTRKKSRKQRVDDVTILTSQKVRQGLPQLCQEAGMWQQGELGTEGLCRNSENGKSGGSGGPAKSRAVYTHPLCCDEWRHEIQLVNPEISRD